MIDKIKKFFESNIQISEQDNSDHQLKLATAALLVEMMQQDLTIHEAEEKTLVKLLQDNFDLSEIETHELVELAHAEASQATDMYQFTRLINMHYTAEQKITVIEQLWSIAYADRHLDSFEEHMVRKIADLIYVSHKDFMQAKHRVQERLGIES